MYTTGWRAPILAALNDVSDRGLTKIHMDWNKSIFCCSYIEPGHHFVRVVYVPGNPGLINTPVNSPVPVVG